MRRIHPFTIIVLAAIIPIFCWSPMKASAGSDYPDGIEAYWKFDEDSDATSFTNAAPSRENDVQCTGNCPGLIQNAVGNVRKIKGVVGNGRSFNGMDDGLSVTEASAFDWNADESFSIELWVKRTSQELSEEEVLIGRVDEAAPMQWELKMLPNGRVAFTLNDANDESTICSDNGKILTQTINSSPRWHHVAVVRDAVTDQMFLYVDGVREATKKQSYTRGFTSDTAQVTIGWRDATSQAPFGGGLDEVAIYRTALDEDEIRSHYFLARAYGDLYKEPVRIMPLGDSITEDDYIDAPSGNGWRIAYRLDLWEALIGGFFWSDFVGSQKRGTDYTDFDADCAGFAGIRAEQMATLLDTGYNPRDDAAVTNGPYLDFYPTDIILLHIGTNDVTHYGDDASDVEKILNEIDEFSQDITVVLARIINRGPTGNDETTTNFNKNIYELAQRRIDQGDKIILVDMENGAGINYGTDMRDDLHPTPAGYNKMAQVWLRELESLLPQSQAPVIVSTPNRNATLGKEYTYAASASGKPAATFALTEGPTGMNMDAAGVITWTPSNSGDFDVSITATNWVDSDTQSFTLHVSGAPEATNDNYGPVLEGDVLNITATSGVLANDGNADDNPLTAMLVAEPSHGQLTFNSDGSFIYTHDGSEPPSDSFSYRAVDSGEASAETTVTINISPVNDAPEIIGQDDLFILEGESYTIKLDDLIVVDEDSAYPGDFVLTVMDGSHYRRKGATITADKNFSGSLKIPLKLNDGQADSPDFQLEITVISSKDPDSSSNGGGGGACFIESMGY
jgi:VCBS repeat-containing protein